MKNFMSYVVAMLVSFCLVSQSGMAMIKFQPNLVTAGKISKWNSLLDGTNQYEELEQQGISLRNIKVSSTQLNGIAFPLLLASTSAADGVGFYLAAMGLSGLALIALVISLPGNIGKRH